MARPINTRSRHNSWPKVSPKCKAPPKHPQSSRVRPRAMLMAMPMIKLSVISPIIPALILVNAPIMSITPKINSAHGNSVIYQVSSGSGRISHWWPMVIKSSIGSVSFTIPANVNTPPNTSRAITWAQLLNLCLLLLHPLFHQSWFHLTPLPPLQPNPGMCRCWPIFDRW